MCVLGMVYALTGTVGWEAAVASIPVGFFVTVVAYLKSARFDVVEGDADQVVLKLSRTAIIGLLVAGYVSLVAGALAGSMPLATLVGLLSLPLAFGVVGVVRGQSSQVSKYLWATVRSIVVSVIIGIGIAAGFIFPIF